MLSARLLRRLRSCRYELLEPRQVLSATLGLNGLQPDSQEAAPHAFSSPPPDAFTPDQIREAYNVNGITFSGTVPATSVFYAGEAIAGPGIRASTTISAIVNGTTLTLSSTATLSGTKSLVAGTSLNITTTMGSTTATLTSTSGLTVGQSIVGPNIPLNATIVAIPDSITITLSAAATATGTKATVIGSPYNIILTTGARTARTVATTIRSTSIPGDGKGTTVAIVDAFSNPTIVSDVSTFSTQFDLPHFNVAGGPTFKVVNQRGSTSLLPTSDLGWALEIALDVEWVHAIAPEANILLVEAANNSNVNLDTAVTYARSVPGVVVVSNSYGGGEGFGEWDTDSTFSTPAGHTGVTFVFSAGDTGGPAAYGSASPNVLSVGGTILDLNNTNDWSSETVWNDAFGAGGGGESLYENVPSYQQSLGLTTRGTPDVSYAAEFYAVYSSFAFGGWEPVFGTSAGAPQWSALIAIADQGRALLGKNSLTNAQAAVYKLPSADFHDITSGNNDFFGLGLGITGNAATTGYDLASGLGTPIVNLVVRDLVTFNGSTTLTTGRTGIANSNGVWYFFSKSAGDDNATASAGGVMAGDTLSADLADATIASVSDSAQPVTSGENGYLSAPPTESPTLSVDKTSSLIASQFDDVLNPLHRTSTHHFAAEAMAAVDHFFDHI